ncbi:MAG: DUF2243 domain-containing protein [Microcoleus vaginatus WJT46-NPBG5]|jgi:uncharacterized membrane protein|nr:DUF2243 domain-containing protein [Microcoleus vaginatus WJT46-NPBG5]
MNQQGNVGGTLIAAGILLGMSAAGFFDGIVLHEILQWHQMLTSVMPPTSLSNVKENMVWDGFFHAGVYIINSVGIWLLWRAGKQGEVPASSSTFAGALLIGAGGFNLIEGLIDHQILGIHHVKPGPNQLTWDLGFLVFSALLVVAGWILLQRRQRDVTA